jgi:predicted branched-subunit amino acid permease
MGQHLVTAGYESQTKKELTFMTGLKMGMPIAIGYIPIAIAFGLVAKSSNVPSLLAMFM